MLLEALLRIAEGLHGAVVPELVGDRIGQVGDVVGDVAGHDGFFVEDVDSNGPIARQGGVHLAGIDFGHGGLGPGFPAFDLVVRPEVILVDDAPPHPIRIEDLKQAFRILRLTVGQDVFPLLHLVELGADGLLGEGEQHHGGLEFRLDEEGRRRADDAAEGTRNDEGHPPVPDAFQEGGLPFRGSG